MYCTKSDFFSIFFQIFIDKKTFICYNEGVPRDKAESLNKEKGVSDMMTRKIKKTVKAYLAERPSIHIGMSWDSEGLMLVLSNSDTVFALPVKRSKIMSLLNVLTVIEEECSEASGGGWHLRVNGSTAAVRWAVANGGYEQLIPICSYAVWKQKVAEYQAISGERTPNAGRTAEWLLGQHFVGSVLNQHNDRKNSNESDITLADGTCWEIKCIALNSRAQIKVQDGTTI